MLISLHVCLYDEEIYYSDRRWSASKHNKNFSLCKKCDLTVRFAMSIDIIENFDICLPLPVESAEIKRIKFKMWKMFLLIS